MRRMLISSSVLKGEVVVQPVPALNERLAPCAIEPRIAPDTLHPPASSHGGQDFVRAQARARIQSHCVECVNYSASSR